VRGMAEEVGERRLRIRRLEEGRRTKPSERGGETRARGVSRPAARVPRIVSVPVPKLRPSEVPRVEVSAEGEVELPVGERVVPHVPRFTFTEAPRLMFRALTTVELPKHVKEREFPIPLVSFEAVPRVSLLTSVEVQSLGVPSLEPLLPAFSIIQAPSIKLAANSEVSVRPSEAILPVLRSEPMELPRIRVEAEEGAPALGVQTAEGGVKAHVGVGELLQEEGLLLEVGEFIRKITFGLSGATYSGRPVVIVLPKIGGDRFVRSVALICRELYRISVGGKPKPRWLSRGSKEEIEELLRAGGMIFVVDDEECRLLRGMLSRVKTVEDLESVDWGKLLDRLHELFSQDYGFIIFHVNEKIAEKFRIKLAEISHILPEALQVELPELREEARRMIASLCWGVLPVDLPAGTFDKAFREAENRFYKLLEKELDKRVLLKHWMQFEEGEGREHRALKLVAAEALGKELGAESEEEVAELFKRGFIKAEYELGGEGRADLCIEYPDGRRRFVEVETLYGVGREYGDPQGKLEYTLEKYRRAGVKDEVSIVLIGLHMLLYAEMLLKLKKIYRKEHRVNVEFYAINVEEPRLVPMKEVLEKLKELKERLSFS